MRPGSAEKTNNLPYTITIAGKHFFLNSRDKKDLRFCHKHAVIQYSYIIYLKKKKIICLHEKLNLSMCADSSIDPKTSRNRQHIQEEEELDGVGPVDNRPSTD